MSLGERIYRLRTEKNLSQGDLAERLEVSRQSVSKWENNNAVPDLEKIIALSEIFEVSLDELVKGETTKVENTDDVHREQRMKSATVVENTFPPRKIAGTILLCMGFVVLLFCTLLGGVLSGLVFCLPFVACGIICFACKTNVGLWCIWAVYVLFDIYSHYAMGISRSAIRFTHLWTAEMNFGRLAIAWILTLILVAIIVVTVIRLSKKPFVTEDKCKKQVIVAWSVVLALQVAAWLWGRSEVYRYILDNFITMGVIYNLISLVFSWVKIIALTIAVVITVRFIRTKKQEL